jgi:hypothetical protein
MMPNEWIAAWRRGEVQHDWAEITVEAGDHAARFRVSAQPLKAGGVTRSIGARGLQRLADLIGDEHGRPSLLLTDKLADERRRQATVVLDPLVGNVVHTTEEQSSEWIWWALANNCARAVSGQWLVAGGWKIFTLDRRCTPTASVNRGFYVEEANTIVRGGKRFSRGLPPIQGRPGANGIEVRATTVPGLYAIQVQGAVLHGVAKTDDDREGLDQADYSQKGELLGGTCWVRRAGSAEWDEMATAAVLTDPELCVLAVGDGKPLPFTRLPGVPILDPDEHAPDTTPPPPSNGPRELPSIRTRCSPAELYAALAEAAPELQRKSLLVLLAQWSLETGEGRECRCWNLGNAKGRPDGSDGRSWQYFSCNEILPAKVAARIVAAAPPRKSGTSPSAAITSTRPNGDVVIWFYPNHPYACFRAFATLDEGARDYVQMQRIRFASAWPAVLAGDPAAFGHALKLAHYYTADEAGYVGALYRFYQRYEATV